MFNSMGIFVRLRQKVLLVEIILIILISFR